MGAASARRLEEARLNETSATDRVKGAEARLAQYETTRQAGTGTRSQLFAVRSPISGAITEVRAVSVANVQAGEPLFRVVDANTVYVTAHVPESDLTRLHQITGAEQQTSDGAAKPIGCLVSTGRVVDPQSRTVLSFMRSTTRIAA